MINFIKTILISPTVIVALLIGSVIPLSAFEAHVVNVTAQIVRRPCIEIETRSYGFWKNHPEFRIYPQTLGDTNITNDIETTNVFNLPDNIMINKLKKQLLALKFNVSFYDSGSALVPGESTTINQLIFLAEFLLTASPTPTKDQLEAMKNRVESANTAGHLSTCSGGGNGPTEPEKPPKDKDDKDKDKEEKDKENEDKNKKQEIQTEIELATSTEMILATSTAPTTESATTTPDTTATITEPTLEVETASTTPSSSPES